MTQKYLLFLLLACGQVHAMQVIESDLESSHWVSRESKIRCELVHTIPAFGYGRFLQSSGGELAFEVHVDQPPVEDGVASLVSQVPFWKQGQTKTLAELSLSKGKMPFYVGRSLALRMMYELEVGMMPTFQYKDWADRSEEVQLVFSSVNFQQALPAFQQCVASLLPYGFNDLNNNFNLFFRENKAALEAADRQALERLARYAASDHKVMIRLDGYADSRGSRRYNLQLSERRTRAVMKYLLSHGVKAGQIIRLSHGETRPLKSNRTLAGRAHNRRVQVSVSR